VTDTEIQINGMAHVILCVSDFDAARKFYERLLPALGMTPVCDTDKLFYCVAGALLSASSLRMLASASSRAGSGCTTCACAHARARISIDYTICCVRWALPSFMRRRTAHGHRAITRCCSKTLMAFAWKRTLFRALACLPLV
jgi:hypothetical protein